LQAAAFAAWVSESGGVREEGQLRRANDKPASSGSDCIQRLTVHQTGQPRHDPGRRDGQAMSDRMTSDPAAAIEGLREAVARFWRFVSELPDGALVEKAWGPKEVLAHLVFWHESYVAQAEAWPSTGAVGLPRGRFEEINARAVAASRGLPAADLLRRYRDANKRLCRLAQADEADSITLRLKRGSVPRPLAWFVTAEAGHIGHHLGILERQARRDPAGEAERLREAVDEFCRVIAGLPVAALVDQPWGPKQVLAHLVIAHELCVAQINAFLAGEPFMLPRGVDLEARVVEAGRGVPVADLVRRFRAADARLRHFGRTLDPQDVVLETWRLQMKRGSLFSTLDHIIARIEAHVRSHSRDLARGAAGNARRTPV